MGELNSGTDLVPSLREEGGNIVATVKGEIDLHRSPELRTALLSALDRRQPRKLILDLSAVPYMDSSAIAVLVEALKRVSKGGGKVYLTSLQPRVKGLLEIARLDTIFVVAKDEADALAR